MNILHIKQTQINLLINRALFVIIMLIMIALSFVINVLVIYVINVISKYIKNQIAFNADNKLINSIYYNRTIFKTNKILSQYRLI